MARLLELKTKHKKKPSISQMKIVREKVKDDEEDWLKSRVTDLMESELSEPIVSAIEF